MLIFKGYLVNVETPDGRRTYAATNKASLLYLLRRLSERNTPGRFDDIVSKSSDENGEVDIDTLQAGLRSEGVFDVRIAGSDGHPLHIYHW